MLSAPLNDTRHAHTRHLIAELVLEALFALCVTTAELRVAETVSNLEQIRQEKLQELRPN